MARHFSKQVGLVLSNTALREREARKQEVARKLLELADTTTETLEPFALLGRVAKYFEGTTQPSFIAHETPHTHLSHPPPHRHY